ncbi:DUF1549 domain-containing protein [Fimbriiglobus ruber]|uniref:BIG2 domain-containing protein n=1 Tax=Fimbriiglobus ruber TaxID=1908690 RepID=A0A225DE73_9BACT|nr:DUF1549 domain-containing protein [Fimbriiglobus ruber]OWK34705.1 hypothetical protein FRUB_09547 [Fimbriiglobus ruber]
MRPLAVLSCVALFATAAPAADQPVKALNAYPPSLKIRGADDAPQLVVTGVLASGRQSDLTSASAYTVSNPSVVRVDKDGRVYPLANGSAVIAAKAAGQSVDVPVTVEGTEAYRPINFTNQIEPVLTKLSCNSGGCHGKIAGQNGFRLSLLGFDPELDYMTLVKEARGRRLFPAAPDQSLFLVKAAGVVPHGGGKKMEVGSEEYKLLRRWIASGLPYGTVEDPVVTKVTVFPETQILERQSRQQLVVRAHYSDGSIEDVTRRAQYESNETEVATVSEFGLVQSQSMTGQSGVMVRFSGVVTVFRAVVPRPGPVTEFAFASKGPIDPHTAKKWKELGITPSDLCTDEQFVRRAYLDITGTLPTAEVVRQFVTANDSAKRDKLIDRLVETPEYAYLFANKWADVLRVKRRNQTERAPGTFAFHSWIRDAVAADKPYDEFVRDIVCAIGDETKSPPTVWYKEVATPEQFVDDVSQVFLGQRLACANCHHHPYEKWTQDDYWGIAAFFARVGKKQVPTPGRVVQNQQNQPQFVYTKATGSVTNKRTNKIAPMKPLDGEAITVSTEEDPRVRFADWLTDPKNPFFAKAVANRYWAHFFGRGIVDPLDDMRVTNPPSNPELLDALAQTLVDNKFSLKALVKVICKSRTYQLSSTPNEFNKSDKQSYARYYPKRLPAEVVFDAVCSVTQSPSDFPGLPKDRNAPARALMLPDEAFGSYFLDVLGRPQRISACECERVNEASLAMTLHMLNSQEVQDKLARANGRTDKLLKDPRPDAQKVEDLFLLTVGHKPTAEQTALAMDHLAKNEKNKKQAYENILWALINSKAFLFNQ